MVQPPHPSVYVISYLSRILVDINLQVDRDRQKFEQYLTDLDRPWWFKTAREVRESDEAKVRDYKEDIDTLLVFVSYYALSTSSLTQNHRLLGCTVFCGNHRPSDRVI